MRTAFVILFLVTAFVYVCFIVTAGLLVKPVSSDLAVVLGNEVLANGQPSARLKARLDCAISLYRRKLTPYILVSGGIGKSGFDEATVMARYLVTQGIEESNILIDSKGVNTMATALNTAFLANKMHFSRIILVTQYYHILRTEFAFKRAGMLNISADYPRYFELFDILATLREAVALPDYFIKMPRKEGVQ